MIYARLCVCMQVEKFCAFICVHYYIFACQCVAFFFSRAILPEFIDHSKCMRGIYEYKYSFRQLSNIIEFFWFLHYTYTHIISTRYITHIQIYSNTCVQLYLHMCEDILSSAMLREIYLNAYIHTHKQTYTNRKDIPTKTTKC